MSIATTGFCWYMLGVSRLYGIVADMCFMNAELMMSFEDKCNDRYTNVYDGFMLKS